VEANVKAAAHLRLVDTQTGELVEHEDPADTIRALQASLSRLQRSYDALIRNKAAERRNYRRRADIDMAFEDWKNKLVAAGMKGKARCKLSDDRFDAMKAIAEAGYTLQDFQRANTGIATHPYVVYGKRRQTGSDDALNVDIAWVCEKARRFEECARLGYLMEKERAA
jgi:hypothetical protein